LNRTVRTVMALTLAAGPLAAVLGAEPPPPPPPPPAAPEAPSPEPGWLGFFLGDSPDGGVKVIAVAEEGPAAKAGVREGDLILTVNQKPVTDRRKLRSAVAGLRPGEKVVVETLRDGKVEIRVIQAGPRVIPLTFLSRTAPLAAPEREALEWAILAGYGDGAGARIVAMPSELRTFYGAPSDAGALVTAVAPASPASAAGLLVGDVLVRAAGEPVREPYDLQTRLAGREAGAPLDVEILRKGKLLKVSIPPAAGAIGSAERAARIAAIDAEMARLKARMEELRREIERLRKTP